MVKPKFYRKVLKNGMTVVLEERKNSGVVSVAFAVKHGGIHESSKEKGISHFIEHLLYKGTTTRSAKKISEEIEKKGGVLNGFTEEEMTAYWCKMPHKHLDVALDVLSDMVRNPLFDETELNKERQVIFEEMKMRKDMPHYYVLDKIQNLLYEGNLGMDIIGTPESMNSLTREKIFNKFKEIYRSGNMILCVVGEANFKKLCNFCEKTFSKSSGTIVEPEIFFKNSEKIEKRAGIDQANMVFAFHAPSSASKDSYANQVLTCLMAGGMSSRLWQEIREKRNLAYSVKGNSNSGKRFGYNYVYVGTNKENIQKIRAIILEEFCKVKDLDKKELEQIKEQLIGNSKISREDSQGQMLDLLYNEVWGNAKNSYAFEKGIKAVNLADVKRIANFKNYSFIALVPE